jgi:hypothetical protein
MSQCPGRSEAGPCNKDKELASLMPSFTLSTLELVMFIQSNNRRKCWGAVWILEQKRHARHARQVYENVGGPSRVLAENREAETGERARKLVERGNPAHR